MSGTETEVSRPEVVGLAQTVSEPVAQPTDEAGTPATGDESLPGASVAGPTEPSPKVIQVKFQPGSAVDSPELLLPPELRKSVAKIVRLFILPERKLHGRESDRLRLWFRIILKPNADADDFIEKLRRLPSVRIAEFAP